MAYFSNGTENDMYVELYCEKCIHLDDDKGCPIMNIHWLHNYEQCEDTDKGRAVKAALDILIPRDKDGWNMRCAMFKEAR